MEIARLVLFLAGLVAPFLTGFDGMQIYFMLFILLNTLFSVGTILYEPYYSKTTNILTAFGVRYLIYQ